MPRALGVLVVMLGVLIGTSSLGQAESGQIEPGKRIGPIALEMPVEEVVASLGQPDRMATYSSGQPDRYFYDGQQLEIQFDHPLRNEIPSCVYMIHTTSNGYVGADGVTIGSSSANVARAYGTDYEGVQGEGFWVMFYGNLGIRFEYESGSDLVREIGVLHPKKPAVDEVDGFGGRTPEQWEGE